MGKTLGIIGGGQLGMMLTEAAKHLKEESASITDIVVLDPTPNCPAAQVGAKQIIADFKDKNAIKELAQRADIITYEIESGDSQVLSEIEKNSKTVINPSPNTLHTIQDKYLQKSFLQKNGIPVAEFEIVESQTDIENISQRFGYPVLLKARRDAYDGRGNYKIDSQDQIKPALDYFKSKSSTASAPSLMVERFVPFEMEVSVIAARNTHGEISTYPVVENIHKENILYITVAPARVNEQIAQMATKLARKTMEVLEGAGVFGIEMFVVQNKDGVQQLLINEIAPRVHNSGHHTLESSKTSQFEQHLRAIMGLPLADTTLLHPTVMYNILGMPNYEGEYKVTEPKIKNSFLKMYGKKVSKPKRKLGHINIIAPKEQNNGEDSQDSNTIQSILAQLKNMSYSDIITATKTAN